MQTLEVEVKTEPAATLAQARPEGAFPQGRWTMLSNVSLFRNPFTKIPTQKEAQLPVQTELLLDSVKPVRNDLSDCDLEVVSAVDRVNETDGQKREESMPAESAVTTAKPPETELAWERIKSQFLGAGKS